MRFLVDTVEIWLRSFYLVTEFTNVFELHSKLLLVLESSKYILKSVWSSEIVAFPCKKLRMHLKSLEVFIGCFEPVIWILYFSVAQTVAFISRCFFPFLLTLSYYRRSKWFILRLFHVITFSWKSTDDNWKGINLDRRRKFFLGKFKSYVSVIVCFT